jgi:hypothetical protein
LEFFSKKINDSNETMVKRKLSGDFNIKMNEITKEIKKRILYLKDLNEIDKILNSNKFDEIDLRNLYYGRLNDEIESLNNILKKIKNNYPELMI